MNRIDRLTAMILMLQSHRVVTAEQIAGHFELSVRTVYRDLSALGEAGVPIVAEAGVGYSLMPGYHMPPVMFSEEEAAALLMSGELCEQFGDESLKLSMRGALLKVRAALPDERNDYLRRLGDVVRVWGPGSGSADENSLMQIQEAVVRRRCVALRYDTGGIGKAIERVVVALGLIFYSRHWHLIAWCRLRKGFRDFRLDRMKEWQVLDEIFLGHEDFSMVGFLQDCESDSDFVPAVIECENWALERVLAEMPARVIEKEVLSNKRTRLKGEAYSLDWLANWLLGLGVAVEACEPPELRQTLAEAAQKIVALYRE
jgi:predicted DNA-binding transcriptional regulator YafY